MKFSGYKDDIIISYSTKNEQIISKNVSVNLFYEIRYCLQMHGLKIKIEFLIYFILFSF